MKRAALVSLLLSACASHEPTPAVKDRTPGTEGPVTAWLWRGDTPEPANPSYLLGVVGQTGVKHCPGGEYDRQWLALHPTIGRVGVSGPPDDVFDPVMEQPVVAIGQPSAAPKRPPLDVKIELCPMLQMRSDWRETPRGMMVVREPSPSIEHFEVVAVRELFELQARSDGDHVVVTLHNPVPVSLDGVELRVHYEGCFGKPGTTVEVTTVGTLAVGAEASARVPQILVRSDARPGRDTYRASSVQLVATGESAHVDLDVSLSTLGLPFECPSKGKK